MMTATPVVAENLGRALPPPATAMPTVAADKEIREIIVLKNEFLGKETIDAPPMKAPITAAPAAAMHCEYIFFLRLDSSELLHMALKLTIPGNAANFVTR